MWKMPGLDGAPPPPRDSRDMWHGGGRDGVRYKREGSEVGPSGCPKPSPNLAKGWRTWTLGSQLICVAACTTYMAGCCELRFAMAPMLPLLLGLVKCAQAMFFTKARRALRWRAIKLRPPGPHRQPQSRKGFRPSRGRCVGEHYARAWCSGMGHHGRYAGAQGSAGSV